MNKTIWHRLAFNGLSLIGLSLFFFFAPTSYAATTTVAHVNVAHHISSPLKAASTCIPNQSGNVCANVVCNPTQTNNNSAFPYTSTLTNHPMTPPPCSSVFHWGYTVSGSATGQAEWDSPTGGGQDCQAAAFIPDNHAGAYNAQYYLWDGNSYIANKTVNQETSTGWVNLYGNYYIQYDMRVTLSDHDAGGVGGRDIAAYAVRFTCSL